MKIVLIGLGSIGKRHLNNLLELGYKDISLVSRRDSKYSNPQNLKSYATIKEACTQNKFDYAFICTPTALHFGNIKELIAFQIPNLYVEKPIVRTLKEAIEIKKLIHSHNINITIGYDLHFDIGLNKIKELLENQIIGKVCTFKAEVGQYLPDWRPHEDYRQGMSASTVLGGGVMLDLVHEFDYVNWIFGPVKSIFGRNGKLSDLEIETEDISVNIIETKKGVIGTICLDYLQTELARNLKVVGSQGVLIWDYIENEVKWMTHENRKWTVLEYKKEQRNDRFKSIIKAFMNSSLEQRDSRLSTLDSAIESLVLVESAKLTNVEKKEINL